MLTGSHPAPHGDDLAEATDPASAPGSLWCAVRVRGPHGAVDVSLPGGATVAEIVDELTGRLLPGAPLAHPADSEGWSLHRLGGRPFGPDQPLAETGVRDGESLHLSTAPLPQPAEPVDDGLVALAEGASAVHRWSAGSVGGLLVCLMVAVSALTGLLTLGLPIGPPAPLLQAGLLLGLAVALRRRGRSDDLPVLGACLASLPAWAFAGLAAAAGLAPTTALSLTLVGAAVTVGSALAWLVATDRGAWWAFTGAAGASLAVTAAVTESALLTAPRAVAVVVTVWLAILVALPWLFTRGRGWLEPDDTPGADLVARAESARRVVDAVALAGGATVAIGGFLLAPRGDGITVGFVAAVAVTALLRARRSVFVVESAAAVGAGVVGLGAVALGLFSGGGPGLRAGVVAVAMLLVVGLIALAAAVHRVGSGDGGAQAWWDRPRTRRMLNWLETATALAVLPLLAGVLGVYTAAANAGAGL